MYDEIATSELESEGLIGGLRENKPNETEESNGKEAERGWRKKRGGKTKAWKRFASGELNRFHPISDAVNSNQRSFPFGLWQTIELITDRDKARGVPANMCTDIGRVELPFFPSRFLRLDSLSFLASRPPSFSFVLEISRCLVRSTHACLRGKRRGRMEERKRGNRDTIGPGHEQVGRERERKEGEFSVCTITTGISSNAPLLPTFPVSTSLMFLYRSGKGVESGRDVEEGWREEERHRVLRQDNKYH